MARSRDVRPEFSRVVDLADLGDDEVELDVQADESERAALARRFSLVDIAALSAAGRLRRLSGGRVRLNLAIRAEVTQTCVVTLEPVVNRVHEAVEIMFEPAEAYSEMLDVDFDSTADREPLTGDSIDVGEVVAEELALCLDPYPRKPGVSLESGAIEGQPESPKDTPGGPFEALAALKRKE